MGDDETVRRQERKLAVYVCACDQIHREAKQEQREEWEMMKLSEDRRES